MSVCPKYVLMDTKRSNEHIEATTRQTLSLRERHTRSLCQGERDIVVCTCERHADTVAARERYAQTSSIGGDDVENDIMFVSTLRLGVKLCVSADECVCQHRGVDVADM